MFLVFLLILNFTVYDIGIDIFFWEKIIFGRFMVFLNVESNIENKFVFSIFVIFSMD